MALYTDGSGRPRIRYGTEVESTKAQLRTATKLGLELGTLNTVDGAMAQAALNWTRGARH